MKVLLVHNWYQQSGGEDIAFTGECEILRQHGVDVITYIDDNRELIDKLPLKSALEMIWSLRTYRALKKLIQESRPDVVHFHNTFYRISPSAYYACKVEKIPIIQTIHNYRLLCPSANFLRDNQVCELCLGKKVPLPGIRYACYRNSHSQTAGIAIMLSIHNILKTYHKLVHTYITPTDFTRLKFIAAGYPEDKFLVKPNFLYPDPGMKAELGDYTLYVGRLSSEKGIPYLLAAWDHLKDIPLYMIGDGPLAKDVATYAKKNKDIQWLGALPRDKVIDYMKRARILVFPSISYEVFPLVIIEALAVGLPVVTSRIGNMMTIIENNRNGIHFIATDSYDLARCVNWAFEHPDEITQMGLMARQDYVNQYSGEANFKMLSQIYENAIMTRDR